jgi:hypothetical protein
MSDRKPMPRTIRGGRPFFFADPAVDKVLNMVVKLGSEVWALRERLAAVEGIQVRQGSLGQGEVDDYEFTPEQETALAVERKEFIDNLFRILQEQVDAVATSKPKPAPFGARISKIRPKVRTKSKTKSKSRSKTSKSKTRRR